MIPSQRSDGEWPPKPWLKDALLTRQEAADYTRTSLSTIDRARKAGKLQFRRTYEVGRGSARVLIRRRWLDEWVDGNLGALVLGVAVLGCVLAHSCFGLPCPVIEELHDYAGIG